MTTHQIFLSPGAFLLAKQHETIAHEFLLLKNNLFPSSPLSPAFLFSLQLEREPILTFDLHVLLWGDHRSQELNVAQLILDTAAELLCAERQKNVTMLLSDVPTTIPLTPPLFG